MASCPRDCTDGLCIKGWRPTAEDPLPAVCPIHIGDLSEREIQVAQTAAAMAHYPKEYEAALNEPDEVLTAAQWMQDHADAMKRLGSGARTATQQAELWRQAMGGAAGGGSAGSGHSGSSGVGGAGGGAGGAGGVAVGFDVGQDDNARSRLMRYFNFSGRGATIHGVSHIIHVE